MASGSERRARKLHPKPATLAARNELRGIKADAVHVDDPDRDHGAGDVARMNAERVAKVAAAQVLLEAATRMASDAYAAIRGIVGNEHHSAVYAARAVDACNVAERSARQTMRAVERTL